MLRDWSARNARSLNTIYEVLSWVLNALHPVFKRIGYERLDAGFAWFEKRIKGFLFDSQSCGQCTLGSTGMVCPMNCPKTIRNGPCGGVRQDGGCEVKPEMSCVWVNAWQGSQRLPHGLDLIQIVQLPVNDSLKGSSAWLRDVRERRGQNSAF